MAFARTVIEQPNVQRYVDENRDTVPGLTETFEGLKWRLARRPEDGYQIPDVNPPHHIIKVRPMPLALGAGPALLARYTYDDDTVTIHGLIVGESDY